MKKYCYIKNMEKKEDLDNLIYLLENNNLLADNIFEQELLKNRLNITYNNFINIYNNVELQYKRCLSYIEFNLENKLDKLVYENIYNFINESDLQIKYNIMKTTDNIIYYNVINKDKSCI